MTEKAKEEQIDNSKIPFKKRLLMAQNELKAPKNQFNNFGKYNYRSAEDILEAAKKVNMKFDLVLTLSDEIIQKGNKYYLKASAILKDVFSDEYIETTAEAQEAPSKKGMDESQITGTASSYARKYALNALYLIDDTKDADTDEYKKQTDKGKSKNDNRNQMLIHLMDSLNKLAELSSMKDQKTYTSKAIYEMFCAEVVGKLVPSNSLTTQQVQAIQAKTDAMLKEYQAK